MLCSRLEDEAPEQELIPAAAGGDAVQPKLDLGCFGGECFSIKNCRLVFVAETVGDRTLYKCWMGDVSLLHPPVVLILMVDCVLVKSAHG